MEARVTDKGLVVDSPAQQRFYAASGVGRPTGDGGVRLTWVEAVYLLERGDLDSVGNSDFLDTLADPPDVSALDRWLVYRDLRERGYYVSTAYQPGAPPVVGDDAFIVRPRGSSPTSDSVAFCVGVLPEAETVPLDSASARTIAIADDETEITYLSISPFEPSGSTEVGTWPSPPGRTCGRRVIVPDPPSPMIDPAFFGRQLDGGSLVLNALEARYLQDGHLLELPHEPEDETGTDRRYPVYAALRDNGCVPRSGLKFGADFRVYTDVSDATNPGHSSYLVEVVSDDATTTGRRLSRAARLAGGVRKKHVYALIGEDTIRWLSLERHRP